MSSRTGILCQFEFGALNYFGSVVHVRPRACATKLKKGVFNPSHHCDRSGYLNRILLNAISYASSGISPNAVNELGGASFPSLSATHRKSLATIVNVSVSHLAL